MESNKIIKYKGKPCIEASVVMLPTDTITDIILVKLGKKEELRNIPLLLKDGLNIYDYKNFKYQHLYITSDEEIKEGDNVYNIVQKTIFIADKSFMKLINNTLSTNKKIIATTDKYLMYLSNNGRVGYNLLQPSQAFIKAYVKANGIGFEKVLVQYKWKNEVIYGNMTLINHNEDGSWYSCNNCKVDFSRTSEYLLKQGVELLDIVIDQNHNTITIHPVKPKMYTKDEVEHILTMYAEEEHAWFSCKSEIDSFNNWIDNNLQ